MSNLTDMYGRIIEASEPDENSLITFSSIWNGGPDITVQNESFEQALRTFNAHQPNDWAPPEDNI